VKLQHLPKDILSFIRTTRKIAKSHNVKIKFLDTRFVTIDDDIICNGYFDEDVLELVVGTKKPLKKWFPIFVHESCHMDQWIEQCPAWTADILNGDIDAGLLIHLWIKKKIELNREQLKLYINAVREIEIDCEKRTVEKIKKYDLPLDPIVYTQQSNTYLYWYTMVAKKRSWYKMGKELIYKKNLWSIMPTEFQEDYNKIPLKIIKAFENQ
jgi:hypothetical protein